MQLLSHRLSHCYSHNAIPTGPVCPAWDSGEAGIWKYKLWLTLTRAESQRDEHQDSTPCEDSTVHAEFEDSTMYAESHHFQWHMPPWREESCQDARLGEPSKGNPNGISRRKPSLGGNWDTASPTGCGNSILREMQNSGGQIPKQPDLPWELPLLDQINSSSNLKYSVILWIPASSKKNRPEDCTANIPMESCWGISEGCGTSCIWGTSWDIIWRAKSKL